MADHEVYFILDDFDGDLWSFSRSRHVWLVNSDHNTPLAQAVWERESEDYSPNQGVTTFRNSGDRLSAFYGFLGTIDMHHDEDSAPQPWSAIHVRGLSPADLDECRIASELDAESLRVSPEPGGFVIARTLA